MSKRTKKICRRFATLSFVAICIYTCLNASSVFDKKTPPVVNGVLDLTNWDFAKDGTIRLVLNWEFYWNQLLSSEDFSQSKSGIVFDGYQKVPSTWADKSRINIKDKYLRLLVFIAGYYLQTNDLCRIISLMESGFAIAPLDKAVAYTLISALLGVGNYSMAVSYYKSRRDALRTELNREPDEALKVLMGISDT